MITNKLMRNKKGITPFMIGIFAMIGIIIIFYLLLKYKVIFIPNLNV